jgi:hypothetical protein
LAFQCITDLIRKNIAEKIWKDPTKKEKGEKPVGFRKWKNWDLYIDEEKMTEEREIKMRYDNPQTMMAKVIGKMNELKKM